MINITHKELLTFTNLTNLEWEFVDLEAIKNMGSRDGRGDENSSNDISTQLNDLLDPEVFVREIKNEDTGQTDYINIYGAGEAGLAEMRKKDRAILLYTSFIKKPKPQLLLQSRGNKIELASQSYAQT